MTTFREISQLIAVPLALVMFLSLGPLPVAHAAMISTDDVIGQSSVTADRERVEALLAREDVRNQMEAMGVDPDKATMRVASLSDSEVQQIVNKLDELPAGQSAAGTIIGVALAILLVLLVTDILCLTKVYPFTTCVAAR